jgi:hypothetical protein
MNDRLRSLFLTTGTGLSLVFLGMAAARRSRRVAR